MIELGGLIPSGVRLSNGEARLRWALADRVVETGFDRFRPVELSRNGSVLHTKWKDFGDMPLDEPFFQFSWKKAEALKSSTSAFSTDWDTMRTIAASPDLLPFSGVVFHMARTGSTLIHRLLSCTGRVHSLSEVGPIDRILKFVEHWPPNERNEALEVFLAAYRRPRRPDERYFVTKMTDSGASIRLPIFRDAFPQVPWIFVYRDPLEVMASILKTPTGTVGGWFRNRVVAANRLGMPALENPGMWPAEFIARTLRRFCRAAVDAAYQTPPGLFLAVNYSRLPDAIWETIAPHYGIELRPEDIDAMRAEARFASKKTDATEFRPDSDRKRDEATPVMRRLASRFVAPVMEELKSLPQG